MKRFKKYELDACGRILNDPNLKGISIHGYETTGHICNILERQIDDMAITFYKDPSEHDMWGAEIYYYKPGTYDIKYSRNYKHLKGLPKKYESTIKELEKLHTSIFEKDIVEN